MRKLQAISFIALTAGLVGGAVNTRLGRRLTLVVIVMSISGVAACRPVGGLQAVVTGPAVLHVGATAQYTVTITRAGASPVAPGSTLAHWDSSDVTLATVTAEGLVTARAPGQVTIRASPFWLPSVSEEIRPGTLAVTIVP